MFLLVFAATNLDLPLGPLSNDVPQQYGVISGIAGLVSSFGAVGIIIANLRVLYALDTAFSLALALGADVPTTRLSAIHILSFFWIALTSQGVLSTIMAFSAVMAWRLEKRCVLQMFKDTCVAHSQNCRVGLKTRPRLVGFESHQLRDDRVKCINLYVCAQALGQIRHRAGGSMPGLLRCDDAMLLLCN